MDWNRYKKMSYLTPAVLILLLVISILLNIVLRAKVQSLESDNRELSSKYQQQQDITTALLDGKGTAIESPNVADEIVQGYSAKSDSVIANSLVGGNVVGTYHEYTEAGFEMYEPKTCHGFMIQSGDDLILDRFLNQPGNDVVINLPWDELNTNDQSKIKAATKERPVTLHLEDRPAEAMGPGQCYPFYIVTVI